MGALQAKAIQPLRKHSCQILAYFMLIFPYTESFAVGFIFFLIDPEAKRYGAFRLLKDWNLNEYGILIGCGFIEYGFFVIGWYVALLNLTIFLLHWYSTSCWLELIKSNVSLISPSKYGLSISCRRVVDQSVLFYKSLQILEILFSSSVSEIVLPLAHFFLVLVPVICNYALIRSVLPLIPTLFLVSFAGFPFAVVICAFPVAASIYVQSIHFIQMILKLENDILNPSRKKEFWQLGR